MEQCDDKIIGYSTINVNGIDYGIDEKCRLVLKDGCHAVPVNQ